MMYAVLLGGVSYIYLNYKANYNINQISNKEYEKYFGEISGRELATIINITILYLSVCEKLDELCVSFLLHLFLLELLILFHYRNVDDLTFASLGKTDGDVYLSNLAKMDNNA